MIYRIMLANPSWRRLLMTAFTVCVALLFSTTFVYAVGLFEPVDPLPDGCIRPTPPGEEAPLCCLSGFVYEQIQAVNRAKITISDRQGEIGTAYTQYYRGLEPNPYYYVDLTKLTRPITPTDVITLVVSYNGSTTQPVSYTVQKGGQRFDFNFYDTEVRALNGQNAGVAESGQFQNITGVDAGSQGNLYLWDLRNVRMQVLSPDGQWLNRPRWQQETDHLPYRLYTIESVAINRNNDRVYLADPYNERIAVYTTDGDFMEETIPITGFVSSIGIDNDGNVYAYTYYEGIKKYNAAGQLVAQSKDPVLVYDTSVRQIAVSPQGDVFFVKQTPNGIFKFNSDLRRVPFTLNTTLNRPGALVVDDANTLYIYDHATFKLYAFDANGTLLPHSWSLPPFSAGSGVALTYYGSYIYLISKYDGLIFQLPKQGGSPLNTWGGRTNNPSSIGVPADIAIAPDNSLFFADTWTGRIGRQVDNKVEQSWTMTELGHLADTIPIALSFDRNGKLLVITNRNTIQRLRYENTTLVTDTMPWGGSGAELGKFCSPSGVDTDKNGFIFVADQCNHRVQVLREDPASNSFVAVSALTVTGVLSLPLGIAVDDRSDSTILYVVDKAYSHIVKLNFDGKNLTFASVIGSKGYNKGQLVDPKQIDVAGDGSLWVADQYYRVHHIDPNDPTNWHIYGEHLNPAWSSYGVAITKAVDQKELLYVGSWGFGLISSFTPMAESDPVATIVHCSNGDLIPGNTLTCIASGQDGDATNIIEHYEWSTTSGLSVIATTAQVEIPTIVGATTATALGSGLHTLRLRVQDNEGTWSPYVNTSIYVAPEVPAPRPTDIPTPDPVQPPPAPPVTCPAGSMWTMLLYLDADNKNDGKQLLKNYHDSLQELKALNHACVRVAVQIDGPDSIGNPTKSDTERWLIRFDPSGAHVDGPIQIDEQQMDTPDALSDFIAWGQQQDNWGNGAPPTNHYYLAIADHGNAFQGIAFDHTTDPTGNAYLTASDLRAALTTPGVLPIDIVHLDACSMALLDVAYEVREQVDYLIASQYIGWSFFAYADYASYITQWTEPEQLATLIVDRYATLAEANQLPYSLSALKLARVEPVKSAIDKLAMFLKAWVGVDGADRKRHKRLFDELRNNAEVRNGVTTYNALFFDSNSNYLNTPRDAYIDLNDFVKRLQQAGLTADITVATDLVLNELERADGLILTNRHSSIAYLPDSLPNEYAKNARIDMQNASGISLYYPVEGVDLLALPQERGLQEIAAAAIGAATELTYTLTYSRYVTNQLFDFTRVSRWGEFLVAAYGTPPADPTLLATPLPPLAPAIVPATITPTPTPTATPSPTPTVTPPATVTPPPPADPSQVLVQENPQLRDNDNNNIPSTGDVMHFDTMITNQSEITLTNVGLVQLLNPLTEAEIIAAAAPCPVITAPHVCTPVGDIASKASSPASFDVTLASNAPLPQVMLFVDGVRQPFTSVPRNQIYLPVVIK